MAKANTTTTSTTTFTPTTTTAAPLEWYDPESEDIPGRMKKDLGRIGGVDTNEALASVGPDILGFYFSCPDCPEAKTVFEAIQTQWGLLRRRDENRHVPALATNMREANNQLIDFQRKIHAVHNADFTVCSWYGTEYRFVPGIKAKVVGVLWQEWEKTGMGLHQKTIGKEAGSSDDGFRVDALFRDHPAFGKMIQPCGDGVYCLCPPDSKPQAPKKSSHR